MPQSDGPGGGEQIPAHTLHGCKPPTEEPARDELVVKAAGQPQSTDQGPWHIPVFSKELLPPTLGLDIPYLFPGPGCVLWGNGCEHQSSAHSLCASFTKSPSAAASHLLHPGLSQMTLPSEETICGGPK